MLQTIGISAVTSFLCSIVALLLYFRIFAPPGPANAPAKDPQFAKYEEIINDFLDTIRNGQIEAAYKETSPSFQKISTLENFKKLIIGYQSTENIPSSPCSLTEYSEPFPGTIKDLPDKYMIVQAKCEATENKGIKGFNIEFIDDEGKSKISYINVYKAPVTHKKNNQSGDGSRFRQE
ncbi:MAG: hypothetical protein AAB481_01020 [Patescibacteria group bacterium]